MRKLLAIICIVCLMSGFTTFAAETITLNTPSVDLDTKTVTISGTLQSGTADKAVILRMYNAGYTVGDEKTDINALQKIDEMQSTEGGGFSFTFDINVDGAFTSGRLNIYIDCDGAAIVDYIYIGTDSDINAALAKIMADASLGAAAVQADLEQYEELLGYGSALYDAADKAALAKLLADKLKADPSAAASPGTLKTTVDKLALIQNYNESRKQILIDGTTFLYNDILSLDTLDSAKDVTAYGSYNTVLSKIAQNAVITGMMGRNFESLDNWYKRFAQVVVTEGISNPKNFGWGHIYPLLRDNGSYAGLDLTSYLELSAADRDAVDAELAKQNYSGNIANLQSAIDAKIKTLGTSGSKGGGSSSGGGHTSTIRIDNDIIPVTPPPVTSDIFSDLAGYPWAKTAIEQLYSQNIVNGTGDGKFLPYEYTTREQFIKMLLLVMDVDIAGAEQSFSDVDVNEWYAPYITTAKNMGITIGYPDGNFGVGEQISRQDSMVILYRSFEQAGITPEGTPVIFVDTSGISDYAVQAVNAMSGAGVVRGDDTGAFRPVDLCNRAESAVIVFNISKLLREE